MLFQSSTARVTVFQNGAELPGTRFGDYHNYTIPASPGEVTVRFENLQAQDVEARLDSGQSVQVAAGESHDFPFTVSDNAEVTVTGINWSGPRAAGLYFATDTVEATKVIE